MKKSQVEHARALVRSICSELKEPMSLGQLSDALTLVIEMARTGQTLDAYDVAGIPVDKLIARCQTAEDPVRRTRAERAARAFTDYVCTNCGDTVRSNNGAPLGWSSNVAVGDGTYKLLCTACPSRIHAQHVASQAKS